MRRRAEVESGQEIVTPRGHPSTGPRADGQSVAPPGPQVKPPCRAPSLPPAGDGSAPLLCELSAPHPDEQHACTLVEDGEPHTYRWGPRPKVRKRHALNVTLSPEARARLDEMAVRTGLPVARIIDEWARTAPMPRRR